jgi:hypothetical protein
MFGLVLAVADPSGAWVPTVLLLVASGACVP